MKNIISIGIGIIILPSILLILTPLINDILSDDVINNINSAIWNVDQILWSAWTNIIFATIWLIVIMPFIRWFFSFFNHSE